MKGKKLYLMPILVILCLPFMIGDLCDSGGGSDDPAPRTDPGAFIISVRFSTTYPSSRTCEMTAVFSGTYISGSSESTDGLDTPFTFVSEFRGEPDGFGNCDFSRTIQNLRPGRWDLTIGNGLGTWSTFCTVDLPVGSTVIVRSKLDCIGSCRTGWTYPCS